MRFPASGRNRRAFPCRREWRHYDSLQTIISAGEVDSNCYLVGSGIIRYVYFNGDREVTPCFGTQGTMFLSYHSYLFRQGSYYEVQACCPTDLFVIPRKALRPTH